MDFFTFGLVPLALKTVLFLTILDAQSQGGIFFKKILGGQLAQGGLLLGAQYGLGEIRGTFFTAIWL